MLKLVGNDEPVGQYDPFVHDVSLAGVEQKFPALHL
jgi:hypothetical protein